MTDRAATDPAAIDWAAIPKIELHLHLEGAAPPAFIRDEAMRQGLALPDIFTPTGDYRWRDFSEFLDVYAVACSVLTGPDSYHRLTRAVAEASLAEGVIYTEIFLGTDLIGGGDPGAWPDFHAAIQAGAAEVPGIEVRFIALCIRHFGPARARAVAERAAASPGLVGFCMAGDERVHHPRDFAPAFERAREAGLRLTAHAGEFGGPDSVTATLDALGVERIGHGVRASEDPDLVARLADTGVVLEVCPGSNIALGLYPGWAAHPVATLDRAGVRVTLSTDDPPYFRTRLSAEYAALSAAFGWDAVDFARLYRVAVDAAFCDDALKARLRARLAEAP